MKVVSKYAKTSVSVEKIEIWNMTSWLVPLICTEQMISAVPDKIYTICHFSCFPLNFGHLIKKIKWKGSICFDVYLQIPHFHLVRQYYKLTLNGDSAWCRGFRECIDGLASIHPIVNFLHRNNCKWVVAAQFESGVIYCPIDNPFSSVIIHGPLHSQL